ncbi:hypothetical protein [Actinoplanes sp. NPDC026619]|uniref:hypothetical protein n=1 Tax=Actinoplanes sp. NPDC026619 TaxID=3155798 RepID=UPI0033C6787F
MTNWMTAAGLALIAGGLATLISFRAYLFGGDGGGERRSRRRKAIEAPRQRPALASGRPPVVDEPAVAVQALPALHAGQVLHAGPVAEADAVLEIGSDFEPAAGAAFDADPPFGAGPSESVVEEEEAGEPLARSRRTRRGRRRGMISPPGSRNTTYVVPSAPDEDERGSLASLGFAADEERDFDLPEAENEPIQAPEAPATRRRRGRRLRPDPEEPMLFDPAVRRAEEVRFEHSGTDDALDALAALEELDAREARDPGPAFDPFATDDALDPAAPFDPGAFEPGTFEPVDAFGTGAGSFGAGPGTFLPGGDRARRGRVSAAEADEAGGKDEGRPPRADRYGDRVAGWVRPEHRESVEEPRPGEYWTPIPVDLNPDPEPSAKGYGWPLPVERLPAVPDYEPATGFNLSPVPAEPTEVVQIWPMNGERASRIRLPRSWKSRNDKDETPAEWPPTPEPATPEPARPVERRRPRPRPRPAISMTEPPVNPGPVNPSAVHPSTMYVSRHAADPPPR